MLRGMVQLAHALPSKCSAGLVGCLTAWGVVAHLDLVLPFQVAMLSSIALPAQLRFEQRPDRSCR